MPPTKKRKAYFAFHYDDIMRVNNVRNAWKIDHPYSEQNRSFYDSSLWETRQREGDDSLKQLIREGVQYTSAVCVLVGSNTWQRRWVKYEIARSVIDERGLLAVHLNRINHHVRKLPDNLGFNPLHLIGVAKDLNGNFYLCELTNNQDQWQWQWYQDHTASIKVPKYMPTPTQGESPISLATCTAECDFVAGAGDKNIGNWLDKAAQAAGR